MRLQERRLIHLQMDFQNFIRSELWKRTRKTTFTTKWGCFAYNIMLLGLTNALAIFSKIMIVAFRDFIHKFLEVYMDYLNVYSLLKEDNSLVRLIFYQCRQFHISLNRKKCIFCVPFGTMLGLIVCQEGVLVDPIKIFVILNFPSPTSVKQ